MHQEEINTQQLRHLEKERERILHEYALSFTPDQLQPLVANACRECIETFHKQEIILFNQRMAEFIEQTHRSINGELRLGPIRTLLSEINGIATPPTTNGLYINSIDTIYIRNGLYYSATCFNIAHEMTHRFHRWKGFLSMNPSRTVAQASNVEKEEDAEMRALSCINCHACLNELYESIIDVKELLDKGYISTTVIKKKIETINPDHICHYHRSINPLKLHTKEQFVTILNKTLEKHFPTERPPINIETSSSLRIFSFDFHGTPYTITYEPFR